MSNYTINITLKSIFNFIIQNQITPYGYLEETTILLKVSLTQTQTPTTEIRQSAQNTVTGIVTQVSDTYVVMLAKTNCSDIYSEYTVEYSKIIYLSNNTFYIRYNQFREYILYNVPKICYEKDSKYIEMKESLESDLIRYRNDKNKEIKIIFDGVTSRSTQINNIEIIRNFVLFDKFFLFPITIIAGYSIYTKCITTNNTLKNGDVNNV